MQADQPTASPLIPAPDATEPTVVLTQDISEFSKNFQELLANPSWSKTVDTFLPIGLEVGKTLLLAILLLVLVSFIARWAQRATTTALKRAHIDPTLRSFLIRASKYAIWIIAIPVALGVFGIQTTALAAVVGAAGLAIGLGLQGALANISAGLVLLVLRPIRIGDIVNIQGEGGEVIDLGLFHTAINAFNHEVIYIPNQQILSDKVRNLTGNPQRRIEIPVGVAYGTDLRLAEKTLVNAMDGLPSRSTAVPPAIYLAAFGASSIDFLIHVYCPAREFLQVRHDAIHAINDALRSQNIEIPFPQRTISGNLRINSTGAATT